MAAGHGDGVDGLRAQLLGHLREIAPRTVGEGRRASGLYPEAGSRQAFLNSRKEKTWGSDQTKAQAAPTRLAPFTLPPPLNHDDNRQGWEVREGHTVNACAPGVYGRLSPFLYQTQRAGGRRVARGPSGGGHKPRETASAEAIGPGKLRLCRREARSLGIATRRCCVGYSAGETGVTGVFQISAAYSRIARSEENQAMCAVLRMLAAHQAAGSRHSASTRRWVS